MGRVAVTLKGWCSKSVMGEKFRTNDTAIVATAGKAKSKYHGSVKRGLVDMSVTIFMYAHSKTDSKHEICLTIHFPRMFVLSSSI